MSFKKMTRFSTELRDPIFMKGYRFLSFAKKKTVGKNVSKNLSGA